MSGFERGYYTSVIPIAFSLGEGTRTFEFHEFEQKKSLETLTFPNLSMFQIHILYIFFLLLVLKKQKKNKFD